MAIICTPTITVIDISNKIVRVSCNVAVDSEPVVTVVMENMDISTSQKKLDAANVLWNKFIVKRNKRLVEEGIAQELTNLEDALKTNIEGRTV